MRTNLIVPIVSAALLLQAACSTVRQPAPGLAVTPERPPVKMFVAPEEATAPSAVGQPIAKVVADARAAGARCEFFGADSQRVDTIREGVAGSVSVFSAKGDGQDNYAFDAAGKVLRHQRSVGQDYDAGVWKDVP